MTHTLTATASILVNLRYQEGEWQQGTVKRVTEMDATVLLSLYYFDDTI